MSVIINPGTSGGGGGSGTLVDIEEDGSVVVANATALNFVEPDATLVTASGTTANVAMTEYLLRAGRPGTGNDSLVSTTIDGSFFGSATANKGLALNANTATTLDAGQTVYFNRNVDTIAPIDLGLGQAAHVFDMQQNLIWDTTSGVPSALVYFDFASQDMTQWDVIGSGGLLGIFGMLIQPNINGEVGASQMLLGFSELLDFEPIITARGAGCTAGSFGGLFLGKTDIQFVALNVGDTLTVGDVGNTTHQVRIGGDGQTPIGTNFGWTHKGVVGDINHGSVDKDAGLWFPVESNPFSPFIGTTVFATVFSEDTRRALQHAGNGIFGSSATPQVDSVLELVSTPGTPRAFILPRMSGTDETALASPVEGMVIANTTTNKMRYYNGTSWVDAT